ncbi:MAG: nucleotidyltransferase family protein [Candidatus Tumulicola sp.]
MRFAYVVLAAGSSRRMGRDKLTSPLSGRSPLERLAALLNGRAVVIVTTASRLETCQQLMPNAIVLVNERPQDGMTSSLRVSLEAVADHECIGVLLGDKPLLARATLDRLESLVSRSPLDVVYPQSETGVPGHPVYLSRRARAHVAELPSGDTLRELRGHAVLTSTAIPCDDAGAFLDIDTQDDWLRAERFARTFGR